MYNITEIAKGQIRHPKHTPVALMKCIGPYDSESFNRDGTINSIGMYILTKDFPKHHYIVVTDIIESYSCIGEKYCVAHLITHSLNFNNLKVNTELFDSSNTSIVLTKSYITRDKFLIDTKDIEMAISYGQFNLDKLKEAIEY